MGRNFKSHLKSLTDPMLYSSILHTALVAAVLYLSMNPEMHEAPTSDTATIEFNFIENTTTESSELYSAETLPSTNITEPTATQQTEINKSLADFFEQEKEKLKKIEDDKALALERDLAEKERLEREHFAQEQEKQRQLEQERQERRRYQQQLQADIDSAHSKRAADLRAKSSSPSPNGTAGGKSYTGPHLRLARENSRIVGVSINGGCPPSVITHEMTFSWNEGEVRDYNSRFVCTAELGAATESTVIKNTASSYARVGCGPDSTNLYNKMLQTYMTASFLGYRCENGCTGQFECKNGKWNVQNFQINHDEWFRILQKSKPKTAEQFY